MTYEEINSLYFEWMYGLIQNGSKLKGKSYIRLCQKLHSESFVPIRIYDDNRMYDGIDLRYRFGYETDIPRQVIATDLDDRPCSVLEMMVALCFRCEESIMYDPIMGDQTGRWFSEMIFSLGLAYMDDNHYNEMAAHRTINKLLNRQYEPDGRGGLFTIPETTKDLRNVEIWYQMNWFLAGYLRKEKQK